MWDYWFMSTTHCKLIITRCGLNGTSTTAFYNTGWIFLNVWRSSSVCWPTSVFTVWHLSICHDPACHSPPSLDVHSFAQLTTDNWCCLGHPQSCWVRELSAHRSQRLGTLCLLTFDTLTWQSAHSGGSWRQYCLYELAHSIGLLC